MSVFTFDTDWDCKAGTMGSSHYYADSGIHSAGISPSRTPFSDLSQDAYRNLHTPSPIEEWLGSGWEEELVKVESVEEWEQQSPADFHVLVYGRAMAATGRSLLATFRPHMVSLWSEEWLGSGWEEELVKVESVEEWEQQSPADFHVLVYGRAMAATGRSLLATFRPHMVSLWSEEWLGSGWEEELVKVESVEEWEQQSPADFHVLVYGRAMAATGRSLLATFRPHMVSLWSEEWLGSGWEEELVKVESVEEWEQQSPADFHVLVYGRAMAATGRSLLATFRPHMVSLWSEEWLGSGWEEELVKVESVEEWEQQSPADFHVLVYGRAMAATGRSLLATFRPHMVSLWSEEWLGSGWEEELVKVESVEEWEQQSPADFHVLVYGRAMAATGRSLLATFRPHMVSLWSEEWLGSGWEEELVKVESVEEWEQQSPADFHVLVYGRAMAATGRSLLATFRPHMVSLWSEEWLGSGWEEELVKVESVEEWEQQSPADFHVLVYGRAMAATGRSLLATFRPHMVSLWSEEWLGSGWEEELVKVESVEEWEQQSPADFHVLVYGRAMAATGRSLLATFRPHMVSLWSEEWLGSGWEEELVKVESVEEWEQQSPADFHVLVYGRAMAATGRSLLATFRPHMVSLWSEEWLGSGWEEELVKVESVEEWEQQSPADFHVLVYGRAMAATGRSLLATFRPHMVSLWSEEWLGSGWEEELVKVESVEEWEQQSPADFHVLVYGRAMAATGRSLLATFRPHMVSLWSEEWLGSGWEEELVKVESVEEWEQQSPADFHVLVYGRAMAATGRSLLATFRPHMVSLWSEEWLGSGWEEELVKVESVEEWEQQSPADFHVLVYGRAMAATGRSLLATFRPHMEKSEYEETVSKSSVPEEGGSSMGGMDDVEAAVFLELRASNEMRPAPFLGYVCHACRVPDHHHIDSCPQKHRNGSRPYHGTKTSKAKLRCSSTRCTKSWDLVLPANGHLPSNCPFCNAPNPRLCKMLKLAETDGMVEKGRVMEKGRMVEMTVGTGRPITGRRD